jgi:predicted enzyme related to lactoylglutathione lyase
MAETFPRGRFVWHELATTDPDAAAAFYPKVAGWTVGPSQNDPSYRYWMNRGKPVGGLMLLPEQAKNMGAPSNWLPYVAVPDVVATTRQAVALGARTYVEPKDIPGVGKFAVLADPQGATFAVYRGAAEQGGHDGAPNMGEFSWHELMTTDAAAAWEFYHTLFGWVKSTAMDMGPGAGVYQMFDRAGRMIGGMYNKPANVPAPPHWLSYTRVPSADTVAAQVPKMGGRVLNGPMDIPGGDRIVMCMDPQGAAFAVHAVKAAAAVPSATASPKPAAGKPAAATPAKAATKPAARKPAAKKPAAKKKPAKAAKKKSAPARKKKPARARKKKAPARRTARKRTAKKKARRR